MADDHSGASGGRIHLPSERPGPLALLGRRLLIAGGAIVFVTLVAYLGRGGYRDATDGGVSLLDALYYATVSVTTTGYGDIIPVSDGARLATALLVTPARILFLVVLVGTTLEILTERTRDAYRVARFRRRLQGHVIICGYGTKGQSAIAALEGKGVDHSKIVVIDDRPDAVAAATEAGLTAIAGNAARTAVLSEAGAEDARAIVVAPDRDDASVLITLTARELNRAATIVSAVREEENAHLLRESGADSVITSSGAAGRLLGLATESPALVEVLEDLLASGQGLEIVERPIAPDQVGPRSELRSPDPVIAVVRDQEPLRFDDPRAERLQPGDRLVCICANG